MNRRVLQSGITALALAGLSLVTPAGGAAATEYLAFAGTYTGPKSKGVLAFRFDSSTGRLEPLGLAAECRNPTFLAVHPNGRVLYAISEVGSAGKPGQAMAFRIEGASGRLSLIGTQSTGGPGPCHVSVDATGKHLFAANYGGGSVACFPLGPDGAIRESTTFIQHQGKSANPRRQEGPHAHGIYPDPAGRFVLVPDLGLDKVMVYRFDAARGVLETNTPAFAQLPSGAGPRHLAFHPNGRVVYVINELDSTIAVHTYDAARGELARVQIVPTLPEDFKGQSTCAEVQVHPSGRFVWGSNRGHDSLAAFTVDEATGRLTPAGHTPTRGKAPRHFTVDPTGKWMLAENQSSDSISVFAIDPVRGTLTPAGGLTEAGSPVCLVFAPLK